MNTNAAVLVLCALSLGATTYLVVSVRNGGDNARIEQLERKLEAAEKRADAVESLRTEIRDLKTRVGRRSEAVTTGNLDTDVPSAELTMRSSAEDTHHDNLERSVTVSSDAAVKPIEERIAEGVEKRLSAKMDAMSARESQRGEDGKWKAPLDELAKELKLTDAQKADAKRIFEHTRDESFTLLKTQRLDGGSLLDDFAAALKSGADPEESGKQLFKRIFTEKVPGTDTTYVAEYIAMEQDVREALGTKLDKDQMKKLRSLHVDLLDVKTDYDPIGDYVRAKVQ